MTRIRVVDRYTGEIIRPKPAPTPEQIRAWRKREDEAWDYLAQAHVEGRD